MHLHRSLDPDVISSCCWMDSSEYPPCCSSTEEPLVTLTTSACGTPCFSELFGFHCAGFLGLQQWQTKNIF